MVARRLAWLIVLPLPAVLPMAAAAFQLRPYAATYVVAERGRRPSRVGRTDSSLPLSSSSPSSSSGGDGRRKKDRWRRRSRQQQQAGAGEDARRFEGPTSDRGAAGDGDGPDDDGRGGQEQRPAAVPTLVDEVLKGQIELLRRIMMRSKTAREQQQRNFRGVGGGVGGVGALAPNRKGRARTLRQMRAADDLRRGSAASQTKRRLDLGYSQRKSQQLQQRGRPQKKPRNNRRRRRNNALQ